MSLSVDVVHLFPADWTSIARYAPPRHIDSELGSTKTAFSIKFHTAIWILTTGAQMVLGWWYRKTPVFYLPKGWFGPFTWWLSLPFAPAGKSHVRVPLQFAARDIDSEDLGSVSCGAWQMACKRVITMLERVVRDLYDTGTWHCNKLTILGTELTARIHVKQLKRQHLRSLLSKSDSIVYTRLYVSTRPQLRQSIHGVFCYDGPSPNCCRRVA